ncbi:hypothetical protein LTR66_014220 [Elasticomyces elasticus]|nr:hypothetical protein LTR66_014220 [Elasticomyces elasticus]
MNISWNLHTGVQHVAPAERVAVAAASQFTAENIDELLQYEPDYKVLICKDHGYALQNINRHLEKHHSIAAKERKAIVRKYAHYPLLEPSHVPLPLPLGPRLEVLGEPVDAFLCEEEKCGFVSVNRFVIGQHCNKKHDRESTKEDRESWSKVKVQAFFATGGLQRCFTVHVARDQAVDPLVSVEDDADVTDILDECRRAKEEHDREMEKADEMVARTDRTGWFNRTGWPEHLARRNLVHLSHASRMPDRGERLLHQAVKIVDLVIEKSVAGLSSLAIETRRWLKSAKREEADVRPLARLQNPESQRRYAGYWKRFMCYCLRVVATDEGCGARSCGNNSVDGSNEGTEEDEIDEEDQTEDEVDEECQDVMRDARELFPWHGKQKELARELWCALELEDEQTQVEKMLELSGSFIFQTVGDRPFSSALIHSLAVLGIDEEMKRLRTAGDFSYMLAGVVYCTRVIAAEVLLPSADREKQDNAERKRFLRERRRFLADGSYSPMSTMISLLAYGKSIALNTGNSASTQWSRDMRVLRLHGRPIVLERFKEMIHGVVTEAERVLWEDVMHTGLGERFVIPLDDIEDDVTFTKRGYSFVSRAGNGLSAGLDWMVGKLTKSVEGQRLRVNGRWQPRAVRQYIRRVNSFLELLLFLVHTTGGQPARGTEITTARHQNGFLQDRNVFVMDGQVVFVSRYHKTQSLWDKPRVIPRFLPWRVGQLVSIFLAYVCPLREHLVAKVLGGGGWSDHVWAGANGPWETDRLTGVIVQESAVRLGCRLTTLDYRHAVIAIGRQVVGEQFGHGYQEQVGEEDIGEPEMELDSGLELQAGRTEKIGVQTYGVQIDIDLARSVQVRARREEVTCRRRTKTHMANCFQRTLRAYRVD